MKTESEDTDREGRRSKPPIFVRMADEGNIPGRPSPVAAAFLVAAVLIGLGALYLAS
jgi:hypothetical protein